MTAPALPITATLGDLTEGTPDAPFIATAYYDETAGSLVVTSALAVHIPMVPPRCRKPRYQAFHTTATVVIPVDPDHHHDVIQWEDQKEDRFRDRREQVQVVVDDATTQLYMTTRDLAQPAQTSALLKTIRITDEPECPEWPEVWEHMENSQRPVRVHMPTVLDNGAPNPIAWGASDTWGKRACVTLYDDHDNLLEWPHYRGSVDGRTSNLYYFEGTRVPAQMIKDHLGRVVKTQRYINGEHFVACYEPNVHYPSSGYGTIRSIAVMPRSTQSFTEPRWESTPMSIADPHIIDYLNREAKITVTPGHAIGVLTLPTAQHVYDGHHAALRKSQEEVSAALDNPEGENGETYAARIAAYDWSKSMAKAVEAMARRAGFMRRMEGDFPALTPAVGL